MLWTEKDKLQAESRPSEYSVNSDYRQRANDYFCIFGLI
ncbi:hypothetical protein B194_4009 [Serratia plymuthica A30]|nr:hypothetical protein B194_4009 [Serratia plymuthica A30]